MADQSFRKQVGTYLAVLTSNLTQYDQKLSAKERVPNIYRLSHYLGAVQDIRNQVSGSLTESSPEAHEKLLEAIKSRFGMDTPSGRINYMPPVAKVVKAIVAGKPARITKQRNPGKAKRALRAARTRERRLAGFPRSYESVRGTIPLRVQRQLESGKRRGRLQKAPRKKNVRHPTGIWPTPGDIDKAVNDRAMAMARSRRKWTPTDSDKAADALINRMYGRNAIIPDSERTKIRTMLWNTFSSYPEGYRGWHLEKKRYGPKRKKKNCCNPRGSRAKGGQHLYKVHVPKTAYDLGYTLEIRAKTKSSARNEARRYCEDSFHKYTGKPKSQYRLPRATTIQEIKR